MQQNAKQDTMQELNVAGIHVTNVKPFGNSIKDLEMPDGLQTDKSKFQNSRVIVLPSMIKNNLINSGLSARQIKSVTIGLHQSQQNHQKFLWKDLDLCGPMMLRTRRSAMETQMPVIMIATGTLVLNVKIFGHYIKAKEETNGLVDVSG